MHNIYSEPSTEPIPVPFFSKPKYLSVNLTSPMSRNDANNENLHFRENMALPGVGVFPGENPEFIVQHLREAGFPVKAVWAQVSSSQVP